MHIKKVPEITYVDFICNRLTPQDISQAWESPTMNFEAECSSSGRLSVGAVDDQSGRAMEQYKTRPVPIYVGDQCLKSISGMIW